MPGQGPKAKQWCFTLNNYTPEDVDRLAASNEGQPAVHPDVVYILFGREVGESGTPHLQGTICLRSRKYRSQVKQIIGHNPHLEVTQDLAASIEYCKKDDDNPIEIGVPPRQPTKKGEKNCDIENFKRTVKEGVYDIRELRELHSKVVARFPEFVNDYIQDQKPKVTVEAHPLRPWQATLYHKLTVQATTPEDIKRFKREIIFIVDLAGNKGKSWFARYFCGLHDNAQILVPGKKADMTLVVDENNKVFFMDCPRSKQGDFIQYDFLEELKNGMIFSPKYRSRVKTLPTPHVVVCMNEHPDMTKLSIDRYAVTVLNADD
jgi:hypothetical protein